MAARDGFGLNESLVSLQDRLDSVEQEMYNSTIFPGTTRYLFPPHRQLANPSPLGLFGFALVSILAASIKLTTDPLPASAGLLPGTAFFLGGGAQIIASIFQFLNNNAHSATTFGVFGLHWAGQGFLSTFQGLAQISFSSEVPAGISAVYFAMLTIVTVILWVPTFKMNRVIQTTLFFVILVFGFDVGASFNNRVCEIIAGICGLIASSLALYMALLDLVNETWKRPLLPLFPHKEHKQDYDSMEGIPYVPKRTFHKSAFSSVHL